MSLAPWRTLLQQSLEANKAVPFSRYCQLATVKPDGSPANRTVVYRGFIGDSDRLTVTTDTRWAADSRHDNLYVSFETPCL